MKKGFSNWLKEEYEEIKKAKRLHIQKFNRLTPEDENRLVQYHITYETHKLVNKTHWLMVATWILVAVTIGLYFLKYI